MTKKLKIPSTGKGGKDIEASKKKSDIGNLDGGKKSKRKGSTDGKIADASKQPGSALRRKRLPALFWDSTLAKLKIKLNSGKQSMFPVLPVIRKMDTYCIKKCMTVSKQPEIKYIVSRQVPDDMDTEVWIPETIEGLKFKNNGQSIAHSILGSVEDYINKAHLTLKSAVEAIPTPVPVCPQQKILPTKLTVTRKVKQENALKYWKEENSKREKLGRLIGDKTNKSRKEMLMNNHPYKLAKGQKVAYYEDLSETWRHESCNTKSFGFWKQEEQLGDKLRGIHFSLTRTERGLSPEEEVICRTVSCLSEEIDPDLAKLNIKGINPSAFESPHYLCNQPVKDCKILTHPVGDKIQGPAIKIGNQIVRWCDEKPVQVELGITVPSGEANMANLLIENIGSCVMQYQLYKLPKPDTFDLRTKSVDKLNVDDSPGTILPNDTKSISVIFRSKNPGVFSENWKIVTTPRLAGVSGIHMVVWGISKDPKQLGENGIAVEEKLDSTIFKDYIESILDGMIDRICCVCNEPRKSDFPKAVERWFMPEPIQNDLFAVVNKGLTYHSGPVHRIMDIASVSMPDISVNKWSLSLGQIRQSVCTMPDDVKFQKEMVPKNDVANHLMSNIAALSHGLRQPVPTVKTDVCQRLLIDLFDGICNSATRIKKTHGVTLDMDFEVELQNEQLIKNIKHTKSPTRDAKHKKRQSVSPVTPPPPPAPTGSQKLGRIVKGIKQAKKSQYDKRASPMMYMKYLEKLHISAYTMLEQMVEQLSHFLEGTTDIKSEIKR